jgi:hypothetical protein
MDLAADEFELRLKHHKLFAESKSRFSNNAATYQARCPRFWQIWRSDRRKALNGVWLTVKAIQKMAV